MRRGRKRIDVPTKPRSIESWHQQPVPLPEGQFLPSSDLAEDNGRTGGVCLPRHHYEKSHYLPAHSRQSGSRVIIVTLRACHIELDGGNSNHETNKAQKRRRALPSQRTISTVLWRNRSEEIHKLKEHQSSRDKAHRGRAEVTLGWSHLCKYNSDEPLVGIVPDGGH